MKNNLIASIALFGVYRNSNQDTYDLVAKYISAVIAQKEYCSFTPANIQNDLKELYLIDIPIGVIKSVCRNRIEGVNLSDGVFTCTRIPKDKIEKEYSFRKRGHFNLNVSIIRKEDTEVFSDVQMAERFLVFNILYQCKHVNSSTLQ